MVGVPHQHYSIHVSNSRNQASETKTLFRVLVPGRLRNLPGIGSPRGFHYFAFLAVGPIARLFTRQIHFVIHSRPSWDFSFTFSTLRELKFWLQHIDSFNEFSIRVAFCANLY